MSLASMCFVGTVIADFAHRGGRREESLKVLAGAAILAGIVIAHLEINRDRTTRRSFGGIGAPPDRSKLGVASTARPR